MESTTSEFGGRYHNYSSTAGNFVLIETGPWSKLFFLTNNKDQNSAACEMPATLTVTYTAIAACVIETCAVFLHGSLTKQGQFRKGSDVIRLPGLVNFSSHQKLFVVVGSVGIVWSPGQYNTPDPFRPFGTGLV